MKAAAATAEKELNPVSECRKHEVTGFASDRSESGKTIAYRGGTSMGDVLKKIPVREQDPKVRGTNFDEVCYGYNE